MTNYEKFNSVTIWHGTDLWGIYYDGIEILNKKNFDKALEIFNKLIDEAYLSDFIIGGKRKYSDFEKFWAPRSIGNRGICYTFKNNYEAAIRDFSTVLDIDPRNIKTLHNRAHANLITSNLKKGIRDLSKIIKTIDSVKLNDPLIKYLIKSYLKRSAAYKEVGEIDKSLNDLKRYKFLLEKLSS